MWSFHRDNLKMTGWPVDQYLLGGGYPELLHAPIHAKTGQTGEDQ